MLAVIFVGELAFFLLILHVNHALAENEGISSIFYGIAIPIGVTLGLVGGTLWLWQSDIDGDYSIRVGLWCVLGAVVLGLGSMFMIFYEQSHGVALVDATYLVVNASSGGSLVGFVVGVYDSRTRMAGEQATASRDRAERLNSQLSVLNRILRHDIRNSATVIQTSAELVEEDDAEAEQHAKVIQQRAERLTEIGEKARDAEQLVTDKTEHQTIDVSALVVEHLDLIRQQHPEAGITATVTDGLCIEASPLVTSALTNVLDNAIEHNDKQTPELDVTVSAVNEDGIDYVEVRVADNGPGIPDEQIAVLERGYETSLEHTDGFGLWMVNWIVTESGGHLQFEENDPEGTSVCLRFRKQPARNETSGAVRPTELDVGISRALLQRVSKNEN